MKQWTPEDLSRSEEIARDFLINFHLNSFGYPVNSFDINSLTGDQAVLLALECYKTLVEVTIEMASKQWAGELH